MFKIPVGLELAQNLLSTPNFFSLSSRRKEGCAHTAEVRIEKEQKEDKCTIFLEIHSHINLPIKAEYSHTSFVLRNESFGVFIPLLRATTVIPVLVGFLMFTNYTLPDNLDLLQPGQPIPAGLPIPYSRNVHFHQQDMALDGTGHSCQMIDENFKVPNIL